MTAGGGGGGGNGNGKPDIVRKRILAAGISSDDCEKYIHVLRQFLAARLTKSRFEVELLKVLPKDKIPVHNALIRELLCRAQQKREGVPDLPTVVPILDKVGSNPARDRKVSLGVKAATGAGGNRKRSREARDADADTESRGNNGPALDAKAVPGGDKAGVEIPATDPNRKSIADRTGPQGRAGTEVVRGESNSGARPGSGGFVPRVSTRIGGAIGAPRASPGVPMITNGDIPTYNALPYFPIRPGQAMDLDLFIKLRARVKAQAVDQLGLSAVKDDAVALLLHAVEAHVKSLMEAGARQRAARQAVRPHGNELCAPVRGYDFRESALRNSASLLGDEAGMDLERLAMLLY
jgi:Transcriptional regulator of RNA polII, SAGA, subunit